MLSFTYAQPFLPSLKERVFILASDSLEGRRAGTAAEKRTLQLLQQWLFLATSTPSVSHCFSFIDEDSSLKEACNLYCLLKGVYDSAIVLIAHYDHIGWGGLRSRSPGKRGIHPGADDNASGVSALIELAHFFAGRSHPYSLIFAFLSAHEVGLWGGRFLEDTLKKQQIPIKLIITLDMIGRLDTQSPVLYLQHAYISSNQLYRWLQLLPPTIRLNVEKTELEDTDCEFFVRKGVPCLWLSTGYHDDYHRISDRADKLNYAGIGEIIGFIKAILLSLEGQGK